MTRRMRSRGKRASSLAAGVDVQVRKHLPPLPLKARPWAVAALVDGLVGLDLDAGIWTELDDEGRNRALLLKSLQWLERLSDEMAQAQKGFQAFSALYLGVDSAAERRQLIFDYLSETVPDAAQRRADQRAVDRQLGFDVLRERHERRLEDMGAEVELALQLSARLVPSAMAGDDTRQRWYEAIADDEFDRRFARQLRVQPRWQTQVAALEALLAVYEQLRALGLLDMADPGSLRSAVQTASDPDLNPWVQVKGLEVVALLDPQEGIQYLSRRLLPRHSRGADDIFVRRRAVELIVRYAEHEDATELLRQVVYRSDPSEYVRQGLCSSLGALGTQTAVSLLRSCAGLDPKLPEPSHRVRASAVIALAQVKLTSSDPLATDAALATLLALLESEAHPFVLTTLAEELALSVEAHASQSPASAGPGTAVLPALLAVCEREALPAHVHAAAAAAAETVQRVVDPARSAWHQFLREAVSAIAPGSQRSVPIAAHLPPLPSEPSWLGRLLADLARGDFGLYAKRSAGHLAIQRGDRFRVRLWRLIHELGHPAPNKRQAHSHSVGRTIRGTIRAHPERLDEVTPTTVPGERVTIEAERSWGRHLPTVDDLIDLPIWSGTPVDVASSHGTVRLHPPTSRSKRLRNWWKLCRAYADFAELRIRALRGEEPQDRRRFSDAITREFSIRVEFEPHTYDSGPVEPSVHATSLVRHSIAPLLAALPQDWESAAEWVRERAFYFFDPERNSQAALALVTGGLAASWLIEGYLRQRRIDSARERIPLSIGGWGTRGKSGTERLKAALFGGLGYQVFVKTTGCEAMFIHAEPGQSPLEIFIYRPYDKATIWEQRDMLELGANLGADVFLWECMALNPSFVELLQHRWMRDDIVTLTNAYPDHEDIQGPSGMDVAKVITGFIPFRSTLVTSEENFLPLFREVAKQRGTKLSSVTDRDAELVPEDVLSIFPYQEHPKNIALVVALGRELGVDPSLSLWLMARGVVADLGVLKTYPPVRLRGSEFRFINGMSANERNGTLSNWGRTGCGDLDAEAHPEQRVVTVVNNRADRISRSEVFARMLVFDLVADRHVLIGSNQRGFMGYFHEALDELLATVEIVTAEDLQEGESGQARAVGRLSQRMGRLRIVPPSAKTLSHEIGRWAGSAALHPDGSWLDSLPEALTGFWNGPASLEVAAVRSDLKQHKPLQPVLSGHAGAVSLPPPAHQTTPELLAPPTEEDVQEAWFFTLARSSVWQRLSTSLDAVFEGTSSIDSFHAAFRGAYRALFVEQISALDDVGASGDQIIAHCARVVPPGSEVKLMGMQNIKGTGLDFVYRWKALDFVHQALVQSQQPTSESRLVALRQLESFEDYGLIEASLVVAQLPTATSEGKTNAEQEAIARVRAKCQAVREERLAGLHEVGRAGALEGFLNWCEGWVDYLDSIRRRRRALRLQRDLVSRQVSPHRAALEMRAINARQRDGWLAQTISGRRRG